jgi:hypothetical protein
MMDDNIYHHGDEPGDLIYDPVMSKIWQGLLKERENLPVVAMPDGRKLTLTDVEALVCDDKYSIVQRVVAIESLYGIRVKDGQNPLDLLQIHTEYCRSKKQNVRTRRLSLGRLQLKIEITVPFKKYIQRRSPDLIE